MCLPNTNHYLAITVSWSPVWCSQMDMIAKILKKTEIWNQHLKYFLTMYNKTLFEELYFRWHRSDPHFDPYALDLKMATIKNTRSASKMLSNKLVYTLKFSMIQSFKSFSDIPGNCKQTIVCSHYKIRFYNLRL